MVSGQRHPEEFADGEAVERSRGGECGIQESHKYALSMCRHAPGGGGQGGRRARWRIARLS